MNDRSDTESEVLASIVLAVQLEVPEIPGDIVLLEALQAGPPRARFLLSRELGRKPELLTSGRSDASPTAHNLILALQNRGYGGLELPRCTGCGKSRRLPHSDGNGGKRCGTCNRHAATPPCTRCGRPRKGGYRIIDGEPYCRTCWRNDPRTHETCSSCGEQRAVAERTVSGPICFRCYAPPPMECSLCGDFKPSADRGGGSPLCVRCYGSLRRYPRDCSQCGQRRISPYLTKVGPVCPECAGREGLGSCAGCGCATRRLHGIYCSVCSLPKYLRKVISDDDGVPNEQLLGLESYLLRDSDRADGILTWTYRSPMARVVHEMAAGRMQISLRAVAGLKATGATGYLAALLMESGAVPTENFERVRLEIWEENYFRQLLNPTNRKVLERYSAWVINPRFSGDGHLSTTNQGTLYSQSKWHLIAVADLLAAVDSAGFNLHTLPQRAFDEWVVAHGRKGQNLTSFIRWAKSQKLTQLRSEYHQSHRSAPPISDDERWEWVQGLLKAEDLELSARLVGLLSLLYGTASTRLVALRREAIIVKSGEIFLSLGTEPIKVPKAVGVLLLRQTEHGRPTAQESEWLFPGQRFGRHITPAAIRNHISKKGINLKSGKSIALISLSRDMPASVLADLTGLDISTATRWAALSGRDWVDYPRARLFDTKQEPK